MIAKSTTRDALEMLGGAMVLADRNARLKIQLGLVLNVGNYETIRPSVGIELDVKPDDDLDELTRDMYHWLELELNESIDLLLGYTKNAE